MSPPRERDTPYVIARVASARKSASWWGPVKEGRAPEILDAIRRWTELYDEPPTLADWEPSRARRQGQEWRADRWEAGDWPSTTAVRSHFGTMSAAVRAAGFVARRSPSRTRRHLGSSRDVLGAIVEWDRRYGEPPAMTDWDPARARRSGQLWRIARFYEGDWPSLATVRHHFGTLNRGILAAGLRPRAPGERTAGGRVPTVAAENAPIERPQQVLAFRVRSVAFARSRRDDDLLMAALNDLAVAASNWSDEIRSARA